MTPSNRNHSPAFKAKVAVADINGEKTLRGRAGFPEDYEPTTSLLTLPTGWETGATKQ